MSETGSYQYFKDIFHIEHGDPAAYSPLALAYIGDSVFDIMIRTMEVSQVNKQVNKYHKDVSKIVCAPAQAKMIMVIKEHLTEEERDIYKRGRNANSYTKAKNATRTEYRKATGFEALVGYWYLTHQMERAMKLLHDGLIEADQMPHK